MHLCNSLAIYPSPFSLIPSPSFWYFFHHFAHWRGAFPSQHRRHPPFLSRSLWRGSQMIFVTCHPFFFWASVFSGMCWLRWCRTSYCRRRHLLCCHADPMVIGLCWKCLGKSLSECRSWFAKAVFLNDAFHGWVSCPDVLAATDPFRDWPVHSHIYNKSVNTIQAIHVCVCVFVCAPVCLCVCVTQDQVSFGGHYFSTLIQPSFVAPPSKSNLNPSQPFSCLLWSRVLLFFSSSFPSCSASYCKLQCTPSLFGFIPLLHTVPWVPKGDRQRMRTLIVTPARAKPCIFNLLWHYSPSLSLFLSLPPSLFLSFYYHPEHPVRQPQLDSHPAETFHLGPANLGVPSAPGACALHSVCVYKCVGVFTCVWVAVTFAV